MAMPDSQQYPWNLHLIIEFWKCNYFWQFQYMFSCSRNAIENQQFSNLYLIHTWSEKSFKGTFVNRVLRSLPWRVTKVPLIIGSFEMFICQIDSSPIDGNIEFVHSQYTAVFWRNKCQLSFCVRQNY